MPDIKKALLEVHKICINHKVCGKCPFWDEGVRECQLQRPYTWWIDEWKEKQP